ncbi:chloramphenicol phosphotransferase CPT family protein [Streptomyces sp. PTM05]|uniref:Chloramphenicol phosphotransferase CPT family protein n=1 Tax=Streptantibioticus parmotrematis TaxID=2873249 RepID=A0ABS7QJX4_9ACTN|nr:AAA family ATPase [Streptantibioticus parmotrematis]MBY8883478.1 chloramphenicol phosphotransferase CPT family protein [Streptantibioticus parmotrematis]
MTAPAFPAEYDERPAEAPRGRVVLLNGTSSSGKSSIAAELLRVLDGPWFHVPLDAFHRMRSDRDIAPEDLQAEIDRTARGFHRAAAGMAAAGNNIVVDHVLTRRWRLLECLELFTARDVTLVGVRCPLPELERRERERGDRGSVAARQFPLVHAHGVYDIECDTSIADPAACARAIAEFLPVRPLPTAFQRLRREYAVGASAIPRPAATGGR